MAVFTHSSINIINESSLISNKIRGYCTLNVSLRHNGISTEAWNSNQYYVFGVCFCSLRYSACNTHAPYYIAIYGLFGSTIFFHVIS